MQVTDADRAHAAELRKAAGLPPTVEDPSVIAALMALRKTGSRTTASMQTD